MKPYRLFLTLLLLTVGRTLCRRKQTLLAIYHDHNQRTRPHWSLYALMYDLSTGGISVHGEVQRQQQNVRGSRERMYEKV